MRMSITPTALAFCLLLTATPAIAETAITYQGQLQDGGGPFNGTVDMSFALHEDATDDLPVGLAISLNQVSVSDGLFTVELDFGPGVFAAGERFLEIEVAGEVLNPRQQITASPLATHALTVSGKILNDLDCGDDQIPKRIDSSWSCGNDADTIYSAGSGLELSSTSFSLDTDFADGLYWRQGGNAGTDPTIDFVGTSDNTPFELHTGNRRALRIEPANEPVSGTDNAPNLIAGHEFNEIADNVFGATIGGGGGRIGFLQRPNTISGSYGTVGGGAGNTASFRSTVAGGFRNSASDSNATVGGGVNNTANGRNSTISGGEGNTATGENSTVAGGRLNRANGDYSFATGYQAWAEHEGSFVWNSLPQAFKSTDNHQFLINAQGGVGIGTNSPARDLHVKQSSTSNGEIGLQIERSGSSTNNWAFYVATTDNLGFRYNDDLVARIDTSGEFATLSDARFKTDIGPIQNPLQRLLELQPAQYRMQSGAAGSAPSLGLIAQQVRDVIPSAVSESEDTLGIRYNQITALNTAAIIEMNAAMQDDRNRMSRLQTENEMLRNQLVKRSLQADEIQAIAERNDDLQRRVLALEALLAGETRLSERSSIGQ